MISSGQISSNFDGKYQAMMFFFLLNCVPADAVRVVEARPVKEQDGLAKFSIARILELRTLGPKLFRQGFVLNVGEPDGRLGQPPLGVALHQRALQVLRGLDRKSVDDSDIT